MPDELLDEILSRELHPEGQALFSRVPNTYRHGLSAAGLAVSTTKYSKCDRLIPHYGCESGLPEAVFEGPGGHTRKVGLERRPLPTREQVARYVANLNPDSFRQKLVTFGATNEDELIDRIPHQGRGPMVIHGAASYVSGTGLDRLDAETVVRFASSFRAAALAHRNGEKVDTDTLDVISEAMAVTEKGMAATFTILLKLEEKWQAAADIFGEDAVAEGKPIDIYDPMPEVPAGFGLPTELVAHMSSPASWNTFIADSGAMVRSRLVEVKGKVESVPYTARPATRENINEWSRQQTGVEGFLKVTPVNKDRFPSWSELNKAMLRVQKDWSEQLDRWNSRQSISSRWVNLGSLTSALADAGGMFGGTDLDGVVHDARPKPSIMGEEPAEVLEPEMRYLQQLLLQSGTPEDITVWRGDLGPFAAELPWAKRKVGEGLYSIGGHPLCHSMSTIFSAVNWSPDRDASPTEQQREEQLHAYSLGLLDDHTEMTRLIFSAKTPSVEVEVTDSAGNPKKVRALVLEPVYATPMLSSVLKDLSYSVQDIVQATKVGGIKVNGHVVEEDVQLFQGDCVIHMNGERHIVNVKPLKDTNGSPKLISYTPGIICSGITRQAGTSQLTALVRIVTEAPQQGYRHRLYDIVEGELVPVNPNDPLLKIFEGDEYGNEPPLFLDFKSRARWMVENLAHSASPVVRLRHDSMGIPYTVIEWEENRDVFPKAITWLHYLVDCYENGVEDLQDFIIWKGDQVVDLLQEVWSELSAHQDRALRCMVAANRRLTLDIEDQLLEGLYLSVHRPDQLHLRLWGTEEDERTFYQEYIKGPWNTFYYELSRVQSGEGCELELPVAWSRQEQAEVEASPELLRRAMGYSYNGKNPLDNSHVEQMVAERFWRRPMTEPGYRYIDHRVVWRDGLIQYEDPNLMRQDAGILGNLHAMARTAVYPPDLFSGMNLFTPSVEAWKAVQGWKGNQYKNALLVHTKRLFAGQEWGQGATKRAFEVASGWGRTSQFSYRGAEREASLFALTHIFPGYSSAMVNRRIFATSMNPRMVQRLFAIIEAMDASKVSQVTDFIRRHHEALGEVATQAAVRRLKAFVNS